MKKNLFNLLFICFLFAVLFVLTPFKTANAYDVDQVVDFSMDEGVYCNANCSPENPYVIPYNWYGAPGEYRRWGTAGGYSWEIEEHVITAPSGCMVLGCGTPSPWDEPVECKLVETQYFTADQHDPVWPYWFIYQHTEREYCLLCYEEIKETVYERTEGDGRDYRSVHREWVKKNECSKFLSGDCFLDPCSGLTCPEMECEVLNPEKTGRGDGYACVQAITATKTAEPPITGGGATLLDPELVEPKCCEVVGPPHNFTDCSFKDPRTGKKSVGCCPPGLMCKQDSNIFPPTCCLPDEKWDRYLQFAFCNKETCPPSDDPNRTQECTKKYSKTCCLPEPEETCGEMGPGFAYCIKQCPAGTPPNKVCEGLCCKENETCTPQLGGMLKCIADSCDTAIGEHMCSGTPGGAASNIKTCCTEQESCLHLPVNGYPYCRVL